MCKNLKRKTVTLSSWTQSFYVKIAPVTCHVNWSLHNSKINFHMSNHKCFQTTSEHVLRSYYKYLLLQSWTHAARAPQLSVRFSVPTCNSAILRCWWGGSYCFVRFWWTISLLSSLTNNLFSVTALQQNALSVLPLECFESAIFSLLPTCNLLRWLFLYLKVLRHSHK